MNVRITRTDPSVPLPEYQTPGAVAFDIASAENITIPPGDIALLRTGLIIAVPEGTVLLVAARSSLARKKGLMLPNGMGVIDQDYCGPEDELRLQLWNFTQKSVEIRKGERLCQGFFVPVHRAAWKEISGPLRAETRGGFGSTGGHAETL